MIAWVVLVAVILSFGISFFAVPMCRTLAFRLGMLDMPRRHKRHAEPTPLMGGVAIFLAIVLPSMLVLSLARIWAATGIPWWIDDWQWLAVHIPGAADRAPMGLTVLIGAFALHVLGLLDDKYDLGPWVKLGVQLAAAVLVVWLGGLRVLTLAGPWMSFLGTVLWLVLLTNSFNFLDNMDGLATSVAAICTGALLAVAMGGGQFFVAGWCCLILGALLGFLPYNFPPARMFMGDAGSLPIGFLLGVVSVLITYVSPGSEQVGYAVFVPLVVMAVPIYDTVSVMWIRIREKRNPMLGDRRHFSHRLLRRGMSKRTALYTICLCTATTALSALILPHVSSTQVAWMVFGQTVAVLGIIALLESGGARR
ncbi:MAG: glycosyltransferase family 4 protein [Phycisphaerae bacterium]